MKDLLEYLITNIVDHKDEVKIIENTGVDGTILFTISVSPEEMGKVIGKEGKIIKAIRIICRVIALREGKKVIINLEDSNKPSGIPPVTEL